MRIVFAGTPAFAATALQCLLEAPGHDVVAVYTQPDRAAGRGRRLNAGPVKRLASDLAIPVCQPSSLREPGSAGALAAYAPEVLVVAAYGLLLPAEILAVPSRTSLNIHASLLPRWRGAAPIQRAILAGDDQTGISIMQIVQALDAGPVLMREATAIDEHDDAGSLHDRLAAIGGRLIVAALDAVAAGTARAEPQDETGVTYAAKIDKGELALDPGRDAASAARQVRAFAPAPGAWTMLGDLRVRLLAATAAPEAAHGLAPGTVVRQGNRRLGVACASGVLWLDRIQAAGREPRTVAEFINGHRALFEAATSLDADAARPA